MRPSAATSHGRFVSVPVLGILASVLGGAADAYRPFLSTDAAVAAPRHVELELGVVGVERERDRDTFVAPDVKMNVGVAPRIELVAEVGVQYGDDVTSNLVDPGVFVKTLVREGALQERAGPSVAVEVGPTFPTGDRDGDGVGFEAIGVVSAAFPPAIAHLNAGAGLTRSGSMLGLWGLIAEVPIGRGFRAAAELVGEASRGSRPEHRLLVAGIWEAAFMPLALDMGLRWGLNDAAADWQLVAGLTMDVGP